MSTDLTRVPPAPPARHCDATLRVTHVHPCQRGQPMDDHIWPRPALGLGDLTGLERVRDHRHSAQLAERPNKGTVLVPGCESSDDFCPDSSRIPG